MLFARHELFRGDSWAPMSHLGSFTHRREAGRCLPFQETRPITLEGTRVVVFRIEARTGKLKQVYFFRSVCLFGQVFALWNPLGKTYPDVFPQDTLFDL